MTEYFRVNVSSATSVNVLNEWGEQKAEVDMQLPGNLLAEVDDVESARMGVMKLQVPLSKLPITSMGIDVAHSSPTSLNVSLNGYVTVIPGRATQNQVLEVTPSAFWKWHDANWKRDWQVSQMTARVHHINDRNVGMSPTAIEIRRGYHEFNTIMELFRSLETAIGDSLYRNVDVDEHWLYEIPQVRPKVNSDNTVSIDVYPIEEKYAMPSNSLVSKDSVLAYINDGQSSSNSTPFPAGRENQFSAYTICVSSSIARLLPSLPWLKRTNFLTGWPEEFMWLLNTDEANVTFQPNAFQMLFPGTGHWKHGTIVTYNFPESDAIVMSDVESILLVMNGTSFNQQVFPVNFTDTTRSAAQIGTIPIIEVYYPAWTKPSDRTSTLIVKRDEFTNSAPININPSLLKERVIKFKLYYITSSGEMREILIPRESPFSFQIAFELTRRRRV